MRNNLRRSGSGVADLLGRVRYEVIPTNTIEDKVLASVPRDVTLTVTASPVKGLAATLDLAERFAGHGYRVVPHISARLVVDEVHLKDIVERMRAIGIDDVFVPAGDADPPAGRYDSALPVLAELTAIGRPFSQVDITGQAMWDKRTHGTYIVSNLCFDPAVLVTWIRRVRRRNVTLPIQVGLAGPVERTKLVAMAAKIGVGESAKFLTKHPSWL